MSAPTPPTPRRLRRRREHLPFFLLLTGLVLAASGVVLLRMGERARDMVAREEAAIVLLERVLEAERGFRERAGRYAWVEELEREGLLEGLVVQAETPGEAEGEEAHREQRRYVLGDGYRVDVLLPHARLPEGAIRIVPRGDELRADPELVLRHVAVVARPLAPGVTGLRTYYVDEAGVLFLNEGVVDDESASKNLLPMTQVRASQRLDTAHLLVWQRASEVEAARKRP